MKQRSSLRSHSLFGGAALAVMALASGCVVKEEDPSATGGAAGSAGNAGSGGSSTTDPCQGVPTTGTCKDENTLRTCLNSEEVDGVPSVKEVACPTRTRCDATGDYAKCVPTGECRDGATECKDDSTLRTCQAGAWVETSCGTDTCSGRTGFGAGCIQQETTSSGIKVRGVLSYEFRKPNDPVTPTEYSRTLSSEPGLNFLTAIYDEVSPGSTERELLGPVVLTSVGDVGDPGSWEIEVKRTPSANAVVYFWPVAWSDAGQPEIAVAKALTGDAISQTADEYWNWGFFVCDSGDCSQNDIDMGAATKIVEAAGSGAAHIFQWAIYDKFRFQSMSGLSSKQPLSLAIFWMGPDDKGGTGIKFDCGNCFLPPQLGGGTVKQGSLASEADHYDSSMAISGKGSLPVTEFDYESHWSRSTLNHEFGHWAMQSFGRSPGEGGPHYVDEVSRPGLAYSEAWATFSGQTNISNSPSDNSPVYFTMQRGTGFWVNLASQAWSGGDLVPPSASGSVDQDINENVVASMMWSLWASANAKSPQSLGDDPMFSVLAAPRLNSGPNRGYPTVDFADYLDALTCSNLADPGKIGNVVEPVGYPWAASDVTCP